MSRNLGRTDCPFCGHKPRLEELPRPISTTEAGSHFDEYRGMLVANATCEACEAKFLAWVDQRPMRPVEPMTFDDWSKPERWKSRVSLPRFAQDGEPFFDLSYRSTFDDAPGPADLPVHKIETRWVRVGPWAER